MCGVTLRWPLRDPLLVLAAAFGYTHWLNMLLLLGSSVGGSWIGLYGLAMASVLGAADIVFKLLITSKRPARTALLDATGAPANGMPSGHSINAVSLLFWQMLELRESGGDARWSWLFAGLLLPVPLSRWYNGDHTLEQVVAGCLIAVPTGIGAYYLRHGATASGVFPPSDFFAGG